MLAALRSLFVFVVVVGVLLVVGSASLQAQIHGVPASVTSIGFGGSTSMTPGVAASVTSLGPNGFGGGHARFGNCCSNAFFQMGTQPAFFGRGRHSHHDFFGGFVPVYSVPYTQVIVVQPDAVADYDDEDYDGGPTIFDRRSPLTRRTRVIEVEKEPAPAVQAAIPAAPPLPVVPQPSTVLVFRDGHQSELQNYAIVGDTLFDLSDNRSHKIQLADLDLAATRKANDARGVDFQVPGNPGQ
jgi:hypothetical protein